MLSSSISINSNYSAVSGEATATFGDVSASSADAAAFSADDTASFYDNTSVDSIAASVVDGPPQSQVVKEIMKNEIESIVVSHLNSPSDFYVQLNANSKVLDMIISELDRHIKSKHDDVPVGHVEIGELTLAWSPNIGVLWFSSTPWFISQINIISNVQGVSKVFI